MDFYNLKSDVPFDLVLVDETLPERGALGFAKTSDRLHKVPVGLIGNIESLIDTSVGYHPDEELFAFSMAPSDIEDEIESVVSSIFCQKQLRTPLGTWLIARSISTILFRVRSQDSMSIFGLPEAASSRSLIRATRSRRNRLESFRKKHVRFLYMKKK